MNNRSLFIALMVILLPLFIWDFSQRLALKIDDNEQQDSALKVGESNIATLTEERRDSLLNALNQYDQPKEKPTARPKEESTKPKIAGMSAAQQQQQQGKLRDLFDGQMRYRLVGTFRYNGQRLAIINGVNITNSKQSSNEIQVGQRLGEYLVERIDPGVVALRHNERVVELQVFASKESKEIQKNAE
ncbi:hypothetical protein LJ739_00990 [Aestuariibacter halophilus]|uniref:Type II secretion system protein GspC N-terminal domain-containing protein n=1 Tax=Fluctibacter halophilus TaxID=226011 RepID=A0ABS8G2K4_9ALTE|nr:hypothetical protein [Aestuariibacter halophilus]MCC2614812.1 hypothetical protein [Aestuariibacter halophilus]